MKRENYFDQLVTTYFDQLWANPFYLNGMGKLMKGNFALRQQWNKQLEELLTLWQLPNQKMQQRTLHTLNTLMSEWRFEKDELQDRLEKMESDLSELKELMLAQAKNTSKAPKNTAKGGND